MKIEAASRLIASQDKILAILGLHGHIDVTSMSENSATYVLDSVPSESEIKHLRSKMGKPKEGETPSHHILDFRLPDLGICLKVPKSAAGKATLEVYDR